MPDLDTLRYPTGRLSLVTITSHDERRAFISTISNCSARLRAVVEELSDDQLNTPYREGGWTVRQLVHHLFDSHCNAYIRFRLGLTEDRPRITAYDQDAWARLADCSEVPVSVSLDLVEGLHLRWVAILNAMAPEDFARVILHPEDGEMNLDVVLQIYAWHSLHHVRHITALAERMGW